MLDYNGIVRCYPKNAMFKCEKRQVHMHRDNTTHEITDREPKILKQEEST